MNLEQIPICISGIDYFVKMSFFAKIQILDEQLIGDTYFIKSNDNQGQFYLSVHKNFYEIIKRDLRIEQILK